MNGEIEAYLLLALAVLAAVTMAYEVGFKRGRESTFTRGYPRDNVTYIRSRRRQRWWK